MGSAGRRVRRLARYSLYFLSTILVAGFCRGIFQGSLTDALEFRLGLWPGESLRGSAGFAGCANTLHARGPTNIDNVPFFAFAPPH